MTMEDTLTEFIHGPGAIRIAGKICLSDQPPKNGELHKTIIAGVAVSPEMITKDGWQEMWEAEIIIIPKKKFNAKIGWLAEDLITSGIDQGEELWGKPYFVAEN